MRPASIFIIEVFLRNSLCLRFFQGRQKPFLRAIRPCTTYSLRQKKRFEKGVSINSTLCFHAAKKLSKVLCSFDIVFLSKYDL